MSQTVCQDTKEKKKKKEDFSVCFEYSLKNSNQNYYGGSAIPIPAAFGCP